MAIPDFQTIFLPLLEACSDGKEYRLVDVVFTISRHFNLSEAEIEERLPSGKQTIIRNRTAWSCTYLKKAGLLESKRRGFFNITAAGMEVLAQKRERINVSFLRQFEGFEEFYKGKKSDSNTKEELSDERTPDELMDEGYKQIHFNLAEDLLEKLRSVDPFYFEHIVGKLLSNMGYGEHEITKRSGDKGIDAIVNQDQLGLDRIFVQAKRYAKNNPVSAHEVRDFVGTLDLEGVQKGVFITTSKFPKDTQSIIAKTPKNIILIDGDKLASLMIEYNVGVSLEKTFEIKKIDTDFFIEE